MATRNESVSLEARSTTPAPREDPSANGNAHAIHERGAPLPATRPVTTAQAAAPHARNRFATRPSDDDQRCMHPLLLVAAALMAGIAADHFVSLPLTACFVAGSAALAAWLIVSRQFQTGSLAVAALLFAVAACGAARHHLHWQLFAGSDLGRFARERAQPIALEALALTGPRHRPAPPIDPLRSVPQGAQTTLRVEALALRDGQTWRPVAGRATLLVDGTLVGVHAGDRLRIYGQLQSPTAPGNPGEFDFALHRRADRELATIRADFPDCVQVVAAARRLSWRRMLHDVRAAGDRILWQNLSHERAGLAAAVLLGAREQLDDEQKNSFLVTGTIHILSISGLHVGILAFVLFAAFRTGWMGRTPALIAVAVVTLAYALLTDSEPPALRATALVWIACMAIFLGRTPLAFNSLALAAIVVLAINPADLFRTGTQLSFLSMAALTALAPAWAARQQPDALARLIRRTRPIHLQWLREAGRKVAGLTVAGLMIWLVTSPLVLHRFHVVSLSALVLNVVLWIPVSLAMVSGFGVLVFGWLIPPLAWFCAAICDANLSAIESTVDAAARVPASHFWMTGPSLDWLVVYYAILALPLVAARFVSFRRCFLFVGVWTIVGILHAATERSTRPSSELVCGFVSVGHGCAVVLELPHGDVWLYDAGRLGSPRAGARSVESYLRSRKISSIDAIILSHADIDHYNAVPELLEKFSVGTVYVSPHMFRQETPALAVLSEAIAAAGVPLDTLSAGNTLVSDQCTARALHPPADRIAGSDNAKSVVLAVEHAGRRVLLTGDLEPPGVQRLLAEPPLDCDVLLAPHHGSTRSQPDRIIAWSTPEWAVVSTAHSAFHSPSAYEPLLGPRALNTADAGAVRISLSPDRVEVRAWRVDPWK